MSHKYDGSFMQSLSDAVERVFGRWLGSQRRVLGHPDALAGHPDAAREYPTPAERRAAWIRENGPDEGEGDE